MNKEKLLEVKKMVMYEIGQTLEKSTQQEIDFSTQMAIAGVLGDLTATLDIKIDELIQSEPEEIKDHEEILKAYRHVCGGKTPEEIRELHTLIEQQGRELNRRDELIRKLDEERDYWELEAKKWAGQLAELRHKVQKEICKKCSLENTSKCKQC